MLKNFRFVASNCRQPNVRPQPTVANKYFNEHTTNDHIARLCKKGLYAEALEEFDLLQKNTNFPIRISSYARLICACSSLRSLEHGRRVHNHLLASTSEPDTILQNHIVYMYGKCGSLDDARKVFDEMSERNVVSWTALIAGYAHNGRPDDAMSLYFEMLRSGVVPDHFTFGSVVKACSGLGDVGLGRQIHAHVLKSEFGSHRIAQNALVAMYTKFGRVGNAEDVFSCIETKDLISWGSIITGLSKHGYELEALSQFREMLSVGVYEPNEIIFSSVLNASRSLLQAEYGRQIHGVCIKFGFGRDTFTGCSLCDMYAKCGFLDSARTVFSQIEKPDVQSCNAMIAGFANNGNTNEAISLFSEMRQLGLVPDEVTVLSLLYACTGPLTLRYCKQVHSSIIKMGFNLVLPVFNSLIAVYSRCFSFYDAYNVFNEIRHRADLVSWNAILAACTKHNQVREAFRLFKLMLLSRIKPDHNTLTNMLGAYADIASLEMGNQVHCYTMKTSLLWDVSVMNGLIDMYTKCGSLGNARALFDSMRNPDIVSWSSLIVGYAQFGYGEEALKLYTTMRSVGVKPNEVTMVGVLNACSHVGLVEEGWQLYRTMETEHGIVPTREHCSCVVDMLARAGYLHEAEDLINQMALDTDVVVWKMLLAACKTHRNVEIGERAAENILKIDPSNSAALVLLCNLYAASSRWEDVARLRSLMKQRGVKKVPGQSRIEVKDTTHSFSAKDSLHPDRERIYRMLEELSLQMLDDGNVPFLNQAVSEPLPRKNKVEAISGCSETYSGSRATKEVHTKQD